MAGGSAPTDQAAHSIGSAVAADILTRISISIFVKRNLTIPRVLAIVRQLREPKPEFPPATPEQQQQREALGLEPPPG